MWFKKKSVLQAEGHYNSNTAYDGTDWRTAWKMYTKNSSSINNSGLPSAADANKYFYLPALGYYSSGQLYSVGDNANYWSSSAHPWSSDNAYFLYFRSGNAGVSYGARPYGFRVGGFE